MPFYILCPLAFNLINLQAAVSDLILGRVEIFLSETRRDGGTEPRSLVSVRNTRTPVLNPECFRRANDVKLFAVETIHLSDVDIKPGCPHGGFQEVWVNSGTDFPLHPSSPHIHHSYITTQYNTYTHRRQLLNLTVTQTNITKHCNPLVDTILH